jgi:hypothetical protein
MRKVEAQTIQAIRELANRADFAGRLLKCGNTEVWQDHIGIAHTPGYERLIQVKLHGHTIAEFYPDQDKFFLDDCGWQTTTTKSRLNAILGAFNPGAGRVYSEKFQWKLNGQDWTGSVCLPVEFSWNSWQIKLAEKLAR